MEENDKEKENEDYVDTFSIDKYLIENLIGNKKDTSLTSSKVHLVSKENVDILPLQMKRSNNDNGKVYIISRSVLFIYFYDYFSKT